MKKNRRKNRIYLTLILFLIVTISNSCYNKEKSKNYYKGIKKAIYLSNVENDTIMIKVYDTNGEIVELITYHPGSIVKSYYSLGFNYKNEVIKPNDTTITIFEKTDENKISVIENNVIYGFLNIKKFNKYEYQEYKDTVGNCLEIQYSYYSDAKELSKVILLNTHLDTIKVTKYTYSDRLLKKTITNNYRLKDYYTETYFYKDNLLYHIIGELCCEGIKPYKDSISISYLRY